jgi:hypothetical protein
MNIRIGTWNVRSSYRAGSLVTVSKELSKRKLDLVGVRVRWEGAGTKPAGEYVFFCRKRNENHEWCRISVHKRIVSAFKRVEFISDRMPYIILRGHWCHIIVLNTHVPTVDNMDDVKGSIYEELEHVFNKYPKYHMKIMLQDFNAKVGREDIFKPTIVNESLLEISNDNGIRVVNITISKNLTV